MKRILLVVLLAFIILVHPTNQVQAQGYLDFNCGQYVVNEGDTLVIDAVVNCGAELPIATYAQYMGWKLNTNDTPVFGWPGLRLQPVVPPDFVLEEYGQEFLGLLPQTNIEFNHATPGGNLFNLQGQTFCPDNGEQCVVTPVTLSVSVRIFYSTDIPYGGTPGGTPTLTSSPTSEPFPNTPTPGGTPGPTSTATPSVTPETPAPTAAVTVELVTPTPRPTNTPTPTKTPITPAPSSTPTSTATGTPGPVPTSTSTATPTSPACVFNCPDTTTTPPPTVTGTPPPSGSATATPPNFKDPFYADAPTRIPRLDLPEPPTFLQPPDVPEVPSFPAINFPETPLPPLEPIVVGGELNYATPRPISATGSVTSTIIGVRLFSVTTSLNDFVVTGYSQTVILSDTLHAFLMGNNDSITQTAVYSVPDWYAPILPREVAQVGWDFEVMGSDLRRRYSVNEWFAYVGSISAIPFRFSKGFIQFANLLGPFGLFLIWLFVMAPVVMALRFISWIKNTIISLFNLLFKVLIWIFELIQAIRAILPIP